MSTVRKVITFKGKLLVHVTDTLLKRVSHFDFLGCKVSYEYKISSLRIQTSEMMF